MTTFLGFDQSLRHSGWALISLEDGAVSALEFGTIHTKRPSTVERNEVDWFSLMLFAQEVSTLLERTRPSFVFTESVFQRTNGTRPLALDLVRIETLLHFTLLQHNCPFKKIPSTCNWNNSWRKLFKLESGKASSKEVLLTKGDFSKLSEHECDAFLILLTGLHQEQLLSQEEVQWNKLEASYLNGLPDPIESEPTPKRKRKAAVKPVA